MTDFTWLLVPSWTMIGKMVLATISTMMLLLLMMMIKADDDDDHDIDDDDKESDT